MFVVAPGDPYRGIRNENDIHGNREWVLGVFGSKLGNRTPTLQDFKAATYCRCPRENEEENVGCQRLSEDIVGEFEAWHPIGTTKKPPHEIQEIGMY